MHKFSDFAKPAMLDGQKIKISELFNKPIAVMGAKITKSKVNNGECLQLQIRMEEKNYVCFTGSTVLIQQIKDNMNEIPFEATITTVGSVYQFT